jgi:hypothetical protein
MAWSFFGMIQGGVRWNRVRWDAMAASSGTTWIALAPVPITPTRLPLSATAWSQAAVWKAGPANASRPGMSG